MDRVQVMKWVRSFQIGEINRREFLAKGSVALGGAAMASVLLQACTPMTGPTAPVVTATAPPAGAGSLTVHQSRARP